MTNGDPLDKETSVSAELTPTGVKLAAKSRLVAAVDRFCGNLVDLANLPVEAAVSRRRAEMDAERRVVEAATNKIVERLGSDPQFAGRAIRNHFGRALKKQLNLDGVLQAALEDLRASPPTQDEAAAGPSSLDENFLDRFEDYAGGASSDELRKRWGRILASEVRRPGQISAKALRVIDEMSAATASSFEHLCRFRLGDVVPKCVSGQLPFGIEAQLMAAELILEPGLGVQRNYRLQKNGDGKEHWVCIMNPYAIAFPKDVAFPKPLENTASPFVLSENGAPAMPVYLLSSVGEEISTVLPDESSEAAQILLGKINAALATPSAHLLRRNAADTGWDEIKKDKAKT